MSLFLGLDKNHSVVTEGTTNQGSQYSFTVTFMACSNSVQTNKEHLNYDITSYLTVEEETEGSYANNKASQ
jgi:hypothetical protein